MSTFRLIVSEKPSVARDIASVLKVKGQAKGWIGQGNLRVTWCVGHLVELEEPATYDQRWKSWRIEHLPMLPEAFQLRPRSGARDQWKIVRGLLRHPDLSEVINACDAGREGELIFAFVYQLAGCRAPVRRLWISSMTRQAIQQGFASLRPGADMRRLEDAARCRAEADWLVGLNATRAMTLRLRDGGRSALLSLGRVQTPTLALLDQREAAIESFVPEPFWQLKVTFTRGAVSEAERADPANQWEATWTELLPDRSRRDRLSDKKDAEAIQARIDGRDGTVTKVERKKKRERPPLLYDLTSLQQEANRRFRFSAQRTLDLAQSLYETHKVITYPRTDSRHLGSDQVPGIPGLLKSLQFPPYDAAAHDILARWPLKLGKRVVDDAEVSDHHAIIPTGVDPRDLPLSRDEKRVFDLIARRFLAVMMPDAVFATALVETTIDKDLFVARGRTLLEPGWQAIDPPASARKGKAKGAKGAAEATLPPVEKGETAPQVANKLHEGVTKPPPRYTEATLLGAMERAGEELDEAELKRAMKRSGLGTPATRASMIETLLSRGYVERDKNALLPTPFGRALLAALPVEALRSPRMTGQWEARLSAMAEGEEQREDFMRDVRSFTGDLVRQIVDTPVEPEVRSTLIQNAPDRSAQMRGGRGGQGAAGPPGELLGTCPLCGGEVKSVSQGWSCGGCSLYIHGTVARRKISPRMAKQLLDQRVTSKVKGFKNREGKEFSAALKLDDQGEVKFHFPQPEELGSCPACGKPVRARAKVYTCDSGRDCPFVIPREMSGQPIEATSVRELLERGRSEPIEGFQRQRAGAGDPFYRGVLEWTGQRVVITPVDERSESGAAGTCPRCGGQVSFQGTRWRCGGCDFSLPAAVAQRELRHEEVAALLQDGRTPRLHGFRQASGAVFKAALVLDDRGEIGFDYSRERDEPKAAIPPGGRPPAFGERIDCPVCVSQASPEPGYVIAGKEAWGCSRWREGCPLRVPFRIHDVVLPDDEAIRLFKKKATRYLDQPLGPPGKRLVCRVVLKPDQKPCWELEPKRPPRRSRSGG